MKQFGANLNKDLSRHVQSCRSLCGALEVKPNLLFCDIVLLVRVNNYFFRMYLIHIHIHIYTYWPVAFLLSFLAMSWPDFAMRNDIIPIDCVGLDFDSGSPQTFKIQ